MALPIGGLTETIFQQFDITPPIVGKDGTQPRQAYDLSLHRSLDQNGFGALVVRTIIQLKFAPGLRANLQSPLLPWALHEIDIFRADCEKAVRDKWSFKHLIVAQGHVPPGMPSFIHVQFEPEFHFAEVKRKHWTAVVFKPSGDTHRSEVFMKTKTIGLDIFDGSPTFRRGGNGPIAQREIVHEFGHTQGLWDEYDDDIPGKPHIADEDSIMNIGEDVRPRHYAPFTRWLTFVAASISIKNVLAGRSPLRYSVVDTASLVDMNNAQLS